MRKLTFDDIDNIYEYEKKRDDIRQHVMDIKKYRRQHLGPNVTIVFENLETMKFQIQEMLRAERLVKDDEIQAEMDVYNALLPDKNELSATVFLEITEKSQIKPILHEFIGLTDGEKLWFEFGNGEKVYAKFEQGRSTQDKISSVHYVRFVFDEDQKILLQDTNTRAKLVVKHKDYHHELPVEDNLRDALIDDVTSED